MYKQQTGLKITNGKNVTINYTKMEEGKNIECCPRCNRMALVKEDNDYIYYQHVLVKVYVNDGIYLNNYATDECKLLN